ncbi:MAG: hypothetical protein ACOCP4_04195 [Candidatus Woesearchaeota archaeon]
MKKICLIEFTPNHYDFIIAAANYFGEIAEVEVFIHEDVYVSLVYEYTTNYSNFKKPHINTYRNYKELIQESFINFDEIIFLSITFTWKIIFIYYLTRKIKIPYSIAIHSINSWLKFGKLNFKNLVRFYIKKRIYEKSKHIIVLSKYQKETLIEIVSKEIFIIPFKLPVIGLKSVKNSKFTIVVPGTVDNKKRDYKGILKILDELQSNCILILLGKMKDDEIKQKIRENENIIWFNGFVTQNIFDKYLKQCDIILAPTIQKYTWGSSSTEFYGITKASGAEFDCIKYRKKLLINEFYNIDNFLIKNNIVHRFSDLEDLKNKLDQLILHHKGNYNDETIDTYNKMLKQNFLEEWN